MGTKQPFPMSELGMHRDSGPTSHSSPSPANRILVDFSDDDLSLNQDQDPITKSLRCQDGDGRRLGFWLSEGSLDQVQQGSRLPDSTPLRLSSLSDPQSWSQSYGSHRMRRLRSWSLHS